MDTQALVMLHTAISLIAIVAGLIVLQGLLTSNRLPATTFVFLLATAATSITGFVFFERDRILPSHVTGIIALAVLMPTLYAIYAARLFGIWRTVYVVGAVVSLYLNVFVLVVQAFLKLPALHALAPQGTEPPFVVAQGAVLLAFVIAGFFATRRFRPGPVADGVAAVVVR